MKQIKLLFLMLTGVLVSINLSSCSNEDDEPHYSEVDHDAEVNGYGYRILSMDELTVEFTALTTPSTYSGAVNIPPTVSINGKDFNVIAIGNYAFNKSSVTSVTIPNSVATIKKGAFKECKRLKNINFPSSVTLIEAAAFYDSGLESITIPSTVEVIGYGSFGYCSNLRHVTIEDSTTPIRVTSLGSNNPSVGSVDYDLPLAYSEIENIYVGRDAVTNDKDRYPTSLGLTGHNATNGGYTVKTITFGSDVTNASSVISNYPSYLEAVVSITCKSQTPPEIWTGDIPNQSFMTTKVYVPASALQAYKDNEGWSKFWNIEAIK